MSSIAGLIANKINFGNRGRFKACVKTTDSIVVTYMLSIPKWVNDKELIKSDREHIIYAKTKRTNKFKVLFSEIDNKYPLVGNNKYYCIERAYNVVDWLKFDDILGYVRSEREKIFRETKSNIMLENIGELTRQWNETTNGKYAKDERKSYAFGFGKIGINHIYANTDPSLPF